MNFSRRKHDRNLPKNINFRNLYIIDSLHDDQKAGTPLSACCLNVQSLRDKVIPVADYIVLQGIDVSTITETPLGTDRDQLTLNESVPAGYEFNHISRKVAEVVVVLTQSTKIWNVP